MARRVARRRKPKLSSRTRRAPARLSSRVGQAPERPGLSSQIRGGSFTPTLSRSTVSARRPGLKHSTVQAERPSLKRSTVSAQRPTLKRSVKRVTKRRDLRRIR